MLLNIAPSSVKFNESVMKKTTHQSESQADRSQPLDTESADSAIVRRVGSLVVGFGYLTLAAGLLGALAEMPLWQTIPIVTLTALTVMACLCYFAAHVAEARSERRQFSLSSLFLLMLPLAIYLAVMRLIWPKPSAEHTWIIHTFWVAMSIAGAAVSTVVLLLLADALMWLAVAILRFVKWLIRERS